MTYVSRIVINTNPFSVDMAKNVYAVCVYIYGYKLFICIFRTVEYLDITSVLPNCIGL